MRPRTLLALLCLTPLAAYAAGDIYRWKDAQGVWHYSDQPQPGAEFVQSTRRPSDSTPAPAQPAATQPAAAAKPSSPPATSGAPPVSNAVAQQVREEAAIAQAEQCRKASEEYDKAIQARRLYRLDEQGNQVYLNAAEIDQARLDARSARDIACASQ
ncbi:MAG: DUF4124 domain-containing protein [Nevskiaceae bacterium]|nr:DUF4124 domain-containing protein [Nevskiaceae bacterium]